MNQITFAFLTFTAIHPIYAGETHQHHSPYAGQETRDIKSLSDSDIAEIRQGGGWGLARAAELNGFPGPVHLLEMKDEIALTPDQITAITRVYESMRDAAIQQGEKMISLERDLENHYRDRTITNEVLRSLLDQIGLARTNLRYIHLSAHLETDDILTPAQIEEYNQLRGYTETDPCAQVPEGHDPEMWRKHNKCE